MNKENIEKLLILAKNGYCNRQIGIELGIKENAVWCMKRKIRDMGIEVPCIIGKPRKKPLIGRISDFNRLDQDIPYR